jgi:hypothetical protein
VVGGDLTSGASDTVLNGTVGRDAVVGGATITVNNAVGRNIKAGARTLRLGSGARVGGNIALTSSHELSKDSGAVVVGKVTRTEPAHGQSKSKHGAIFGFGIVWFVYWFLAMLVTALLLTLLFPSLLQAASDRAMPRPWKALVVGLLASIFVPIVTLLFAVSVLGLPLAFILGLLWFVALLLSGPLFSYYLGRLILHNSHNALLFMLVGSSVLTALYFIPIIGSLAFVATIWVGTGMLLLEIARAAGRPSYDTVPAKK